MKTAMADWGCAGLVSRACVADLGHDVVSFPKGTLALCKTAEGYSGPNRIVEAVVEGSDGRKRAMGRNTKAQ